MSGDGSMSAVRGKYASFDVDSELFPQNMSLRVLDVNGTSVPYEKAHVKGKLYRIRYVPKMVGSHVIETVTNVGSPKKETHLVNVYDPAKIQVLKTGTPVAGENNHVVIDTSGAGKGALSVAIKAVGGRDVRHSITDIDDRGRFEVTFYPEIPAPHRLDVKFNGSNVPAALATDLSVRDPLAGKVVTAAGLGLYTAKVNSDTSFVIDTMGHKSADFDVVITGPADAVPPYEAIPLRCYQQKDGKLLAEFRTRTTGAHKIEVFDSGQHIRNSPFECQSYNPEEVFVADAPKQHGHEPGRPIQFRVDRRHAGLSELDASVTSPMGDVHPIELGLNGESGIDLVDFTPDVAGVYKFVIKYGGEQIPESPLNFTVREPASAAATNGNAAANGATAAAAAAAAATLDLRAFGQGLQKGQIGMPCSFEVEQSTGDPLPEVVVLHPDSSMVKAKVEQTSPSSIKVVYLPDSTGVYLVHLRQYSGETLEYPVTVCNPKSVKIVRGFDMQAGDFSPRLAKGEEAAVVLFVGDAGPGKLEAELTHPSGGKVKTDVVSHKDKAEVR